MSEALSSKWDCDYIRIINFFMDVFTTSRCCMYKYAQEYSNRTNNSFIFKKSNSFGLIPISQ